jgi:hypothetical protein
VVQSGKRAVDVSIDAREFNLVLKQAKAFDRKIYLNLRRDLRKAAESAAKDVREDVKKAPRKVIAATRFRKQKIVAGHTFAFGRHQLREHIAKGVKVQIAATDRSRRVGVFIVSRGSDPTSKMLKRAWDREKGWRHPVFADAANRERTEWKWVPQVGRPYFGSVIQSHAPQIETAVKKALADTVAQLPKK